MANMATHYSILSIPRNLFALGLHNKVLVAGGQSKSDGIRKADDCIKETALLPEEKLKVIAIACPPFWHIRSLVNSFELWDKHLNLMS